MKKEDIIFIGGLLKKDEECDRVENQSKLKNKECHTKPSVSERVKNDVKDAVDAVGDLVAGILSGLWFGKMIFDKYLYWLVADYYVNYVDK